MLLCPTLSFRVVLPVNSIFIGLISVFRNPEAATSVTYEEVRYKMKRERSALQPPMPEDLTEYGHLIELYHLERSHHEPPLRFYHTVIRNDEENWVACFFVSPKLRSLLNHSERIHLDATFKVVPRQFDGHQLLTVHGMSSNHVSNPLHGSHVDGVL